MTYEWKKIYADEPPLQLIVESAADDDVRDAFVEMIRHMVARTEDDGSQERVILSARSNATNGYVQAFWMDGSGKAAGEWAYTVTLKGLWDASLEHEQGAFYFDEVVRTQLCRALDIAPDVNGISLVIRDELGNVFEY